MLEVELGSASLKEEEGKNTLQSLMLEGFETANSSKGFYQLGY